MTINNILNFFSPQQDLQENGDEPGFISQTAVIGTLAAGVLVGFAQYGYSKYSAYRLRCQEYQDLCQGLDKWCQEAEPTEFESRSKAANRIKECYWKKNQTLDLSDLQLTSLPSEIGQLTHLQDLDLYNNRLQQLPSEIGQLTNLRMLMLTNNHFQQLSSEIGQLTNLERLYIVDNQLQQLPPEIGHLMNLRLLNLYGNSLSQLPPEIGQLTNLERLILMGGNYDLQQLPQEILQLTNLQDLNLPHSIAQPSLELMASFRNAGIRVFIESSPLHASSSTFTLNIQQLRDDPISVLRALHELLQKDHSFPKIIYEDSDGADAGGLSRDLVTRLFQEIFDKENPQLPVLELDDLFLPVVDSNFDSNESYQSKELYQAIGMIFAAAARKGFRPIITGKYFHPVLFEMLYCLSQEDISKLPEQFTTLSDLPKDILKKLLSSHLYSKVDGSDDQKKESASLLAEAFIENQFPDLFGIYESREEFLKAYPYADKIMLAAPGALAIAQGMHKFLENWKLNADSAVDLQLNIEGYFSREEVKNILSWQEGENSPQNDQTKEFLKQWIRDETTPLKTISQFLFAGTGSSTIMKDQNLQVTFYSAEGPDEGPEWFPKYHACSFAMEIPRNYPDYETFKRMLEASIRASHFGFQTS